ncbi:MAG: hypothetical protein AAFZ11_07525 [Pseudomonadota bacterium]
MAIKEFFRPGFWDILGAGLGVFSLAAGGTLVVSVGLTGWDAAFALILLILVGVGGYSARAYTFYREFPFSGVEHEVRLKFRIEDCADGSQRVKAKLFRITRFSARAKNLQYFDRFQLVPDKPNREANVVLKEMNHNFDVLVMDRGFGQKWKPNKNIACAPTFEAERALTFLYDFKTPDMKSRAKRYELREWLELPNDFSQPGEWYTFKVSEPARKRLFVFEFENFAVTSARVSIKHGTKATTPETIFVPEPAPGTAGTSFERVVKNATVGSVIKFEWDWDGVGA